MLLSQLFRKKSLNRIHAESERERMETEHGASLQRSLRLRDLTILSFAKKLSAIPVLGLVSCFCLVTQLGIPDWIGFVLWLLGGLTIYFFYGRKASKLNAVLK